MVLCMGEIRKLYPIWILLYPIVLWEIVAIELISVAGIQTVVEELLSQFC